MWFGALAFYFYFLLAAATHCANPLVTLLFSPCREGLAPLRPLGVFIGYKRSLSGVAKASEQWVAALRCNKTPWGIYGSPVTGLWGLGKRKPPSESCAGVMYFEVGLGFGGVMGSLECFSQ